MALPASCSPPSICCSSSSARLCSTAAALRLCLGERLGVALGGQLEEDLRVVEAAGAGASSASSVDCSCGALASGASARVSGRSRSPARRPARQLGGAALEPATSKMPPERVDALFEAVQLLANLADRQHADPFYAAPTAAGCGPGMVQPAYTSMRAAASTAAFTNKSPWRV